MGYEAPRGLPGGDSVQAADGRGEHRGEQTLLFRARGTGESVASQRGELGAEVLLRELVELPPLQVLKRCLDGRHGLGVVVLG